MDFPESPMPSHYNVVGLLYFFYFEFFHYFKANSLCRWHSGRCIPWQGNSHQGNGARLVLIRGSMSFLRRSMLWQIGQWRPPGRQGQDESDKFYPGQSIFVTVFGPVNIGLIRVLMRKHIKWSRLSFLPFLFIFSFFFVNSDFRPSISIPASTPVPCKCHHFGFLP